MRWSLALSSVSICSDRPVDLLQALGTQRQQDIPPGPLTHFAGVVAVEREDADRVVDHRIGRYSWLSPSRALKLRKPSALTVVSSLILLNSQSRVPGERWATIAT